MTNDDKELYRVQYDDLSDDVQKRIDSLIYRDSDVWLSLKNTISSFYESTKTLSKNSSDETYNLYLSLKARLLKSKIDLSSSTSTNNGVGAMVYGVSNDVLSPSNGGTGSTSLANVTVGKAVSDANGNNISETYITKTEANNIINNAISAFVETLVDDS